MHTCLKKKSDPLSMAVDIILTRTQLLDRVHTAPATRHPLNDNCCSILRKTTEHYSWRMTTNIGVEALIQNDHYNYSHSVLFCIDEVKPSFGQLGPTNIRQSWLICPNIGVLSLMQN